MDGQTEHIESKDGSDVFRNVVTGEKASFITYHVHRDRHGRYRMDDRAAVIIRNANGEDERWLVEYVPSADSGLVHSSRVWLVRERPRLGLSFGLVVALLGAAVFPLFPLWVLWLWLRN